MRILVNALSVRSLSGRHVLLGHLRQLARWTEGVHGFVLLHDIRQSELAEGLPPAVESIQLDFSLARWPRRAAWETFGLERLIRQTGVRLVFTPSGTLAPAVRVPQVCLAQNPWCLTAAVPKRGLAAAKAAVQRRAYRKATRRADLMVYNSEHMRDLYRANAGGACERRFRVAYQAIDDTTHDAARQAAGAERRSDLILSVSVMASWKGIETVVRAAAVVRRRRPDVRLRLVGPWPDADYERFVRREIARLELGQAVEITGQVPRAELHRYYAEATVFCLMSRCESFGIPGLEAQAFGTPVVAAAGSAIPEVCGAGGLYAAPDDIEAAADRLTELLEDDRRWSELSAAARANAARFRWETCSRPLLEMFELC